MSTNPFIYSTPDQIEDPKEALRLFVDVLKDYYLIESPGNTFINGPRGSGKSMMFRIMKPDCQKEKLKKALHELSYFGVYIPIKHTSLDIEELKYLEKRHGQNIFNEHFLIIYFSIAIFEKLNEENYSEYKSAKEEIVEFYNSFFVKYFNQCCKASELKLKPIREDDNKNPNDIFKGIVSSLENIQEEFSKYLENLMNSDENLNYTGSIFLYRNFLFPILKEIVKFSFLPQNKPIYLLIDDADFFNLPQTKILNSWVSYRFTSIVCFKITTQLNYKTYYTSNGDFKIDSPHDYHEINLSEIYTSNIGDNYKNNVKAIVEKRLKLFCDIDVSAEEYFPLHKEQQNEYQKLFEQLNKEKGYDYAYRNARPDFMISLSNEYAYNYGGFEQLVHLSSGIIRNFIDASFKMYDKAYKSIDTPIRNVTSIPVQIQNEEVRKYGNWILEQLDKSIQDEYLSPIQSNKFRLLRNLIDSIGKTFRLYLESSSSERRKIAFYYDGDVDKEIKDVLKLGVSEGLLHESTHGSKTGLGRSKKYVLNKMLSPIYKLDPFSFSGYLYVTPDKLRLAIYSPEKFVTYIKERIRKGDKEEISLQAKLDFENEV